MCIINTLALVFYCKFSNRYKNVYMCKWMSVCMNLREFLDFVRGVSEWMDGRPQCKYIVYCYMKLYDLLWNLRKTKIQLSWIECYNCYALITCRHKLYTSQQLHTCLLLLMFQGSSKIPHLCSQYFINNKHGFNLSI